MYRDTGEGFRNAVNISHKAVEQVAGKGDIVVDATCGRGKDTLFLAQLVGRNGKVYAFDIQESAIESTRLLLAKNGAAEQVVLIKDDHINMAEYLKERPKACMFNLGYLPGGNHCIKTEACTTLEALKIVVDVLAIGGIITVVFYPGHPGGTEELETARNYLSGLPQQAFEVTEIRFINQVNNPPQIIIVRKK